MSYEIKKCRICGSDDLISVLHLGNQYLTGVFPKKPDEKITCGPLELVKCQEDNEGKFCGLLQLRHSYDSDEMYGQNYGYRSGLNQSMVKHLTEKVRLIESLIELQSDDIILDIGSNDGTLLKSYKKKRLNRVGIDPTSEKFKKYYPDDILALPQFFSADVFKKQFGNKKAKVITSIAMFYDLEDPINFMKNIYEVLSDEGIWVFEQSYMPTMLKMNAYDTVCHEHLEYYRLKQIKWMADLVGFKIIDVEFNSTNGGSFSVTVAKRSNQKFGENIDLINKVLKEEEDLQLSILTPYVQFKKNVHQHRDQLKEFIKECKSQNKTIFGYGASTKGNVILQFCELTNQDIECIAEVNKDKFGAFTPGTAIPIVSEADARARKPDYFLALPWHFKDNLVQRESAYLESGGEMVFPLPEIEVISHEKSANHRG